MSVLLRAVRVRDPHGPVMAAGEPRQETPLRTPRGMPSRRERSGVAIHLHRLRHSRGVSQLSLALAAGISARHLSFVETGRARPGRDVLLRLGEALELTDDELGDLLASGGFIPSQTAVRAASGMQLARQFDSIQSLLAGLEPVPAALIDPHWDVLVPNAAYVRILRALAGGAAYPRGPLQLTDMPRPNRLRELVNPGVRRALENWPDLVAGILSRVRAEVRVSADSVLQALLEEVMSSPGVAAACRAAESKAQGSFPIRARFRFGRSSFDVFSVVTGWETDGLRLRVELLHPVDQDSASALTALAGQDAAIVSDWGPRPVPSAAGLAEQRT
jgi:transcriptional regulator with XRE-family HTH domain